MIDHIGETRLLVVGDRITAYPCTVTIERVGIAGATGRCDYCADEHVIDRHLYESGRGPWRLVPNGRTAVSEEISETS